MGLLNSMINQVGREIGRDIYRTAKNSFGSSKEIPTNIDLNGMVRSFTLSSYDKVTMKNITFLVNEVIFKANPRTFDWDDLLIDLDSLIDDLKVAFKSSEYLEDIEKLDQMVFSKYNTLKELHKNFVSDLIEDHKNKINSYESRKGYVTFFLSLFGLGAIYVEEGRNKSLAFYGSVLFILSILTSVNAYNTPTSLTATTGAVIVFLVFMFIPYLNSTLRARSQKKRNKENKDRLEMLEKYREDIE